MRITRDEEYKAPSFWTERNLIGNEDKRNKQQTQQTRSKKQITNPKYKTKQTRSKPRDW